MQLYQPLFPPLLLPAPTPSPLYFTSPTNPSPAILGDLTNQQQLRGKQSNRPSLTLTAYGKYADKRETTGLVNNFLTTIPNLKTKEADILAKVTRAGIATATAKNHNSIRRTVLKHFQDRPDLFSNTQPGDPLVITARLLESGMKPGTVRSYMASYDRLVRYSHKSDT